MIYYTCIHCDTELEEEDSLGSKTARCPVCNGINNVPKSKKQLKEEHRQQKKKLEEWRLQKMSEKLTRKREEEMKVKQAAEEALRIKKQAESERQQKYIETLTLVKKDAHVVKNWYCMSKGKEWGPMPESRLQIWISSGRIGSGDVVHPDNVNVWLKVADIPEIFAFPEKSPGDNVKSDVPRCPKCGSTHLSSNKQGVDAGNACCGALLFGPLGLLCGMTDKVVVTCLKCGNQWKVGR